MSTSRAIRSTDKKTVWEEISGGNDVIYLGKREINRAPMLGAFNFKGGDQQKKVGQLSGGERNRVHLAKMLKSGANVMLLDEPTNDLDIETLRALEEALARFRRLRRGHLATTACSSTASRPTSSPSKATATSNGSRAISQEYEEDKKRRLGEESLIPHRMKYKKFSKVGAIGTRSLLGRPGLTRPSKL